MVAGKPDIVWPRPHSVADFRRQDYIFTPFPQGLAEDFFGLPFGIKVRRVKKVDTAVQCHCHNLIGCLLVDGSYLLHSAIGPESHCSETYLRNFDSGFSEKTHFHLLTSYLIIFLDD
jgi:hypothetical protein